MNIVSQGILLFLFGVIFCSAQTPVARAPDIPQSVPDKTWYKRVTEQQRALTNQPCEVCFIGDSLTEFWLSTGKETWAKEFGTLRPINLGLAGDRTENVLSRVAQFDFHRASPKTIVLLMGTNNFGKVPPDEPAEVISAFLKVEKVLRKKLPSASLVILGLPPSGWEPDTELRSHIKTANQLLSKAKWVGKVQFIPTYEHFVDDRGQWKAGLSLDGTHFSGAGYKALASIVVPHLSALSPSQTRAR